jgi:hypothetical protein
VGLIESRIFFPRGQKVMLSTHLAELYQVEPRALVQAVKRNTERFPSDFMFRLSAHEFAPYAFTEQGVAMLSSVLRSDRAIHLNIEIMRAFVRLRQMIAAALFRTAPRQFCCSATAGFRTSRGCARTVLCWGAAVPR